mmetsp:Transcript_7893/g.16888  ORF Transcript_7893/g.16888 Transcript_7893/m.16888 type:complete len:220 (-) Transcript_7893:508-1167(-)
MLNPGIYVGQKVPPLTLRNIQREDPRINQRVILRINQRVNQQINQRGNPQTNQRANPRTDQQMHLPHRQQIRHRDHRVRAHLTSPQNHRHHHHNRVLFLRPFRHRIRRLRQVSVPQFQMYHHYNPVLPPRYLLNQHQHHHPHRRHYRVPLLLFHQRHLLRPVLPQQNRVSHRHFRRHHRPQNHRHRHQPAPRKCPLYPQRQPKVYHQLKKKSFFLPIHF